MSLNSGLRPARRAVRRSRAAETSSTVDAAQLAVIIPTRDRWATLRRTLDALRAQTATGFEVVVVVDGDDQDVPSDLPVDVVETQRQAGPAAARNRGVSATDAQLVLFLGDDMIPEATCVEEHLRVHLRYPDSRDVALGSVRWHPRVAWRPANRWLDLSATQFDYRNLPHDAGADVGFGRFYSCNVSMKRSLFDEVGGFDPDFVFYYEDLEMGWRLGDAGMRLRFAPDATTRHLHPYTTEGVRSRFRGIAQGERMMADKRPEFEPWFRPRIARSAATDPVSPVWRIVGQLPAPRPLQRRLTRRATRWYHQQVAVEFEQAWSRAELVSELAEYLGDDFDAAELIHHARSVMDDIAAADDEEEFYRTTDSYLYDLTVFGMSDTKDPYCDAVRAHVSRGGRLLDYGCGIGVDGIRFLAEGYDVTFADYDCPSTEYLRWRLARRSLDAPVLDIEKDDLPRGFDLAYSFDVLEHVADPWAFLARLEACASLVMINLLEEDDHDHDHDLHHDLPIDEILEHARRRGLVHHAVHHERSHLVCYRGSR